MAKRSRQIRSKARICSEVRNSISEPLVGQPESRLSTAYSSSGHALRVNSSWISLPFAYHPTPLSNAFYTIGHIFQQLKPRVAGFLKLKRNCLTSVWHAFGAVKSVAGFWRAPRSHGSWGRKRSLASKQLGQVLTGKGCELFGTSPKRCEAELCFGFFAEARRPDHKIGPSRHPGNSSRAYPLGKFAPAPGFRLARGLDDGHDRWHLPRCEPNPKLPQR